VGFSGWWCRTWRGGPGLADLGVEHKTCLCVAFAGGLLSTESQCILLAKNICVRLLYSPSKAKAKVRDSYLARPTGTKPDQPRFTIIGRGSWSARVNGAAALMRPSIANANEQLDPRQQVANTPPSQSTTTGLQPVSIHQMAPPQRTSDCWLTTHLSTPKGWKAELA